MFSNRIALFVALLMFAASIGAVVARPTVKVAEKEPISLENIVPREFGAWRIEPQRYAQVVNPQTKECFEQRGDYEKIH